MQRGPVVLLCCDNQSVVAAFNKGRAKDYRLLGLRRRAAAVQLSGGLRAVWRYIETHRNRAD
eukprot:1950547-Alexandrium_andersonii.AAC.1